VLVPAVALVLAARTAILPAPAAPLLAALGYAAALSVLWLNRAQQPWTAFMFVGLLLNAVVITANGGRMPLSVEALARVAHLAALPSGGGGDGYHMLAGPGTRFPGLGDVLPLGVAGRGLVLSPGDVALALGLAGFIQAGMRSQASGRTSARV
jgi:hypothetical protein